MLNEVDIINFNYRNVKVHLSNKYTINYKYYTRVVELHVNTLIQLKTMKQTTWNTMTKHANNHTPAGTQVGRQADRQTGRQAGRQTGRQAGRQAGWQADR